MVASNESIAENSHLIHKLQGKRERERERMNEQKREKERGKGREREPGPCMSF